MTRPPILDLDLVVVPREADSKMSVAVSANWGRRTWDEYKKVLSASPYPTAWDDVRKYVEGLEETLANYELLDKATTRELHGWQQKAIDQCARAEDAEARIAELEKRLADAAAKARLEFEISRAAELYFKPRFRVDVERAIADLDERLAAGVARLSAAQDQQPIAGNPEADANRDLHNDWRGWLKKILTPAIRAARAYMEGK